MNSMVIFSCPVLDWKCTFGDIWSRISKLYCFTQQHFICMPPTKQNVHVQFSQFNFKIILKWKQLFISYQSIFLSALNFVGYVLSWVQCHRAFAGILCLKFFLVGIFHGSKNVSLSSWVFHGSKNFLVGISRVQKLFLVVIS